VDISIVQALLGHSHLSTTIRRGRLLQDDKSV
jgi:site-specific recombinase XerD